MKTKSFQKYLEKRLDKNEIASIEKQAVAEIHALQTLQKVIVDAIETYMQENNIGFNELVRRLDSSPTHVAKIQRGEANLTLASLAHIFSLLGKEAQLVLRDKK